MFSLMECTNISPENGYEVGMTAGSFILCFPTDRKGAAIHDLRSPYAV